MGHTSERRHEVLTCSRSRDLNYLVESRIAVKADFLIKANRQLTVIAKSTVGASVFVNVLPGSVNHVGVVRDRLRFDKSLLANADSEIVVSHGSDAVSGIDKQSLRKKVE